MISNYCCIVLSIPNQVHNSQTSRFISVPDQNLGRSSRGDSMGLRLQSVRFRTSVLFVLRVFYDHYGPNQIFCHRTDPYLWRFLSSSLHVAIHFWVFSYTLCFLKTYFYYHDVLLQWMLLNCHSCERCYLRIRYNTIIALHYRLLGSEPTWRTSLRRTNWLPSHFCSQSTTLRRLRHVVTSLNACATRESHQAISKH